MFKFIASAFIAGTVAMSAAVAADLPKEINIVYVKAPFNLQNIVMKEKGMLEQAFEKDGVKVIGRRLLPAPNKHKLWPGV